jgi:FkbM family methyltransferase
VKEDRTILDIGGHEGYYSILFARLMKDRGRVLAFEPDPYNFEWLRKNIEANGYKSIELHEYALSDKEGDATFYTGGA